jgi:hypothetical protein
MGTGSFPGVESSRGVTLTPQPLLVTKSKKQSRATPLLSLRAFVACKKGETYLHVLQIKLNIKNHVHFLYGAIASSGPGSPLHRGFTFTLRHITGGRTPLDEWSARRRDLYPTTYSTHKRQTTMSQTGFEPAFPASKWSQTHVLDRAITGIGKQVQYLPQQGLLEFCKLENDLCISPNMCCVRHTKIYCPSIAVYWLINVYYFIKTQHGVTYNGQI